MQTQVQSHNRALALAVLLLIVLQLGVPHHAWMMLLIALGGVWFIAFVWAHALARGVTLTRELRFGWAQVGDHLEERFTLHNTSWLPAIWVEIVDHSTLPGHNANWVTGVDADSENRWSIKSVCTRRGAYTLGPTTLITGDPFGLYTVIQHNPATSNMMVMPPLVPLPRIEIAPGGRAGEGKRRADSFERALSAKGVREYVPGDSLNAIHWRTSAHRDSLLVRVFDSTPASDWWIVLDVNQHVQVGEGENSTLEHGIILTASLADRGLRAGHAVGLAMFTDNLVWLPPHAGETRRWEILRALALASAGTQSLATLLTQTHDAFSQRTALILITPDTRADWLAPLMTLRWRGIVPTVLLLDPRSFGGDGDARGALALLAELDIARYVVPREMLDRPEARPGERGHVDWQVTPLGRALPRYRSRETAWRVLG
jgi:uncharacterized protein (DUF58 family)